MRFGLSRRLPGPCLPSAPTSLGSALFSLPLPLSGLCWGLPAPPALQPGPEAGPFSSATAECPPAQHWPLRVWGQNPGPVLPGRLVTGFPQTPFIIPASHPPLSSTRPLHGLCGRCPSPRPGTVSGQARGWVPQRSLLNDGGPGLSLPRWPGSRGGLLSWTLGPAPPRRAPRGGQPAPAAGGAGLLLGGPLQLPPRCATPRVQLRTATSTCHYGAEWIIALMGGKGSILLSRS